MGQSPPSPFPHQPPPNNGTPLLVPSSVSGTPPQPPPPRYQEAPPPSGITPQQNPPQPTVASASAASGTEALDNEVHGQLAGARSRQIVPASEQPKPSSGPLQSRQTAGQAAQQQRRTPAQQRTQQEQSSTVQKESYKSRRQRARNSASASGSGGSGGIGASNHASSRGGGVSRAGGGGHTSRPAGAMVGTGEALLNLRTRGGQAGQAAQESSASTSHEFDFQSELQKFDKEKELAKEMGSLTLEQGAGAGSSAVGGIEAKKYNKSSFFDEISCDVLDRAQGRQQRVTHAAEMDVNMETFGTTGLHHARPNRRKGGRGRGGARSRGDGIGGTNNTAPGAQQDCSNLASGGGRGGGGSGGSEVQGGSRSNVQPQTRVGGRQRSRRGRGQGQAQQRGQQTTV
ncbi:unnamed protein product [Choristocarpus tenellus]